MTAKKDEVAFPRGRSSTTKPALRNVKNKLFGKHKKLKKSPLKNLFFEENQGFKNKLKKTSSKDSEIEPSHTIRPLVYQILEEGMVMVGRIKEILPYHMFVCLPGRLSAKVPISAISVPYTESLTRLQRLEVTQQDCPPLRDLFMPGQAVVCSLVEVKKDGDLLAVCASLDPARINKDRSHHAVRAGDTLVAAVRTVEDHGYTLYSGIAGLTIFLKFSNVANYVKNCNHGRSLVVGEVVRCLVTKCTTSRTASRAEVTIDPTALAQGVLKDGSPQTLHPGVSVNCTVLESTRAGVVVTMLDGRTRAYIEPAQLSNCWSSPKYLHPGDQLTATVLYSLPNSDFQNTSKPVYLTLKDISQSTSPKLEIGDVMDTKVTSSGPRGVCLCLGEKKDKELGNKGFVSIRRLGEIIPKDVIAKKFPKGKSVTAKILGFDYMEEIYNCSFERDKLELHYVTATQARVGDRLTCRVTEVEPIGLRLSLGPVKLYVFRDHTADKPYEDLNQHFTVGDIVDARVLRVNPTTRQIYVTLKETLIRSPALTSYEMANVEDCYWATVRRIHENNSLYVTFYNNVTGIVQAGDVSESFTEGQLVKCYITYVNAPEKKLLLSLNEPQSGKRSSQLVVGDFYQLVVSNVSDDYLIVNPCDYDSIEGLVPKCHLPDPNKFLEGDFLRGWFYHKKGDVHFFSPNPAIENIFKQPKEFKPHTRLTCCVVKIGTKKVTVLTSLPDFPTVQILKEELPNHEQLRLHQIVKLFVQEYDSKGKHLILTHKKPSKPQRESNNEDSGKDSGNKATNKSSTDKKPKNSKKKGIEKNERETSDVEKSTEEHSDGSLHSPDNAAEPKPSKSKENSPKKELSKSVGEINPEENLNENVQSPKNTTKPKTSKSKENLDALIKDNSLKKKLKRDNTEGNSNEIIPNEDIKEEAESDIDCSVKVKPNITKSSDINPVNCKEDETKTKKRKSSKSDSDEVQSLKKGAKKLKTDTKKPTLSESGFFWDIKPEDLNKPTEDTVEDVDEDEEDTTREKKKKKTAAERQQAAKEEEARLRKVEQTLLESENNPQSVDQFDRAVLARPDDDDLWIKYMSHHLQATEIEKARAVARRALQTINQRLETERLNVWIALLNLENLFGTQESLKNTLDEALRTNDEFTVYSKMLNIYSQANKAQEAEQLVQTMLRKFRTSQECWEHCCSALMKCGLPDKARNLLQRAIAALPTKQHVNLLCKFALLENQHGYSEQAQTLFEHILTTYPKRTDIWNVYVDMLVKSNKVNVARQVLERATKQKLPPRKMKMLFSKWVTFEEKNGTPEKVEYVRKQAQTYVNIITSKLE